MVQPSGSAVRSDLQQSPRDFQGCLPTFRLRKDYPAHLEDIRMTLLHAGQPIQILLSVDQIAELNPADGTRKIMSIWRLKFPHSPKNKVASMVDISATAMP